MTNVHILRKLKIKTCLPTLIRICWALNLPVSDEDKMGGSWPVPRLVGVIPWRGSSTELLHLDHDLTNTPAPFSFYLFVGHAKTYRWVRKESDVEGNIVVHGVKELC